MQAVSKTLSVKEFSQDTWADFETLFGKHKGVRDSCWCTFHLCTLSQYEKMLKDERKEFRRDLAYQGLGSGFLVCDAEIPVVWCQFGLAERFPRYDRMRAYQELNLPVHLKPRWRIACLFVDKHRRGEGLSQFALHSAVELVRNSGGGVVEAFPLDVPGTSSPQHTGSERMYQREGFEIVARLGKSTLLICLVI